jgi:hypothetical protein
MTYFLKLERRDILELLGVIISLNDVSVFKEIAKSLKLLRAAKNQINLHLEH